MELQGNRITLCLTLEGLPNYLPKRLCHFTVPSAMYEF